MATDNNTRTNAQTAQENQENGAGIDPAVLASQRRAEAERRRGKRWERWRARKTAIVRRVSEHQPGPQQDARDHRGEVA
jgi:hypothetical protein